MIPEIQEELIPMLMQQSAENVSPGSQSGKPTLLGFDIYKSDLELKKYGHNQMFGNIKQTNGIFSIKECLDYARIRLFCSSKG
jgi:hypothetical protein